jgi:D-alanine-D-alanine ligase
MRIILLHDEVGTGSSPDELDVLAQMDAIEAALSDLGHRSSRAACTLDLAAARQLILSSGADLVFNLVESLAGHGQLIHFAPALLDALAIPYTGCPAEAVWMTSNKLAAKRAMLAADIPTPRHFTLFDLERGGEVPGGRYIIKSVWEHASRGLDEDSVLDASASDRLLDALRARLPQLGGEGFVEAYVEGREFNLSLLGGSIGDAGSSSTTNCTILPPAEIVFEEYAAGKPRVVGYRAKWEERSFEYNHTPRRFDFAAADQPLLLRLGELAHDCWRCFGLRGYARVDFRIDQAGRPFVLEVNTNPCLSTDAGFSAALRRAGLDFRDAVARIISDSLMVRP